MYKIGRISLVNPLQSLARGPSVQAIRSITTDASPDSDRPDPNMANPYKQERIQCILCKYNIELDYKNTRLLSQFISTFTGRIYDKHITGLCEKQQQRVRRELFKAHQCHLLPHIHKNVKFMKDPPLFDPFNPQRPNPH